MEKEKLQQLDNLLLALGFSDSDEKLENCINKYFLTLLNFFRFQNQVISNKVLEILSTINQRLKHSPTVKLPLDGLIQQFYDKETPFLQKNFTIIYLFSAFERISLEEKFGYINKFLEGISQHNPLHQSKLLGLALQTLSKKKLQRFTTDKEINQMKDAFPFFLNDQDRKIILEYLFYFFLSNFSTFTKGEGMEAEGLSIKWKKKLNESLKFSNEKELDDMKIGLINLLDSISPSLLSYQDTILIILAAKSDLNGSVAKVGEDVMRRIDKVKINLEDPILVNRMYDLYLGTEDKSVAKEEAFTPVSPQFKLLILYQLRRSTMATNTALRPVKVFLDALNGMTANMKSRQAALGFAQWMFHQASQPQIAFAGQVIFSYILKLLRDLSDVREEGSEFYTLKDMLYSLFTPICKRIPSLFTRNFETLEEIIKMFMKETVNFQIGMQDGLFLLTNEFTSQSAEFKEKLFGLIEKCAGEDQSPIARYLSVYYAIRVYPFDDIRCRYLCLTSLSHSKQELRDEAKKGLEPYRVVDRDIIPDPTQPFPSFPSAVLYLSSHLSSHLKPNHDMKDQQGEGEEYDLDLYSGSIRFLEKCYIQHISSSSSNPKVDAGDDIVMVEEGSEKEELMKYEELIEFGFTLKREHGIHLMCAKSLLYLAGTSSLIARSLCDRTSQFKSSLLYLHHVDARESIAKLIAILSEHLSLSSFTLLLDEAISSLTQYLTIVNGPSSNQAILINLKDETLHGDLILLGAIIGKLFYLDRFQSLNALQQDRVSVSIKLILRLIGDKNPILSLGAIQSIGTIARYSPLPLPLLDPSLPIPSSPSSSDDAKDEKEGKKEEGKEEEEISSVFGLIRKFRQVLRRESTKEQMMEKIVLAIGDVFLGCISLIERGSEIEKYMIDTIFSLSKIKHEEVLFTAGEALSSIGSGWGSKASQDKLLLNETSSSFPSLSSSVEPMQYIITQTVRKYILSGNADERNAGSIWLLTLIQHSGVDHVVLHQHLSSIQRSFTHMLASSNDLIQEIGSKGLVIVYERGDQSIKNDLVSSLVSTLSQGSKGFKSNEHGDTELFPSGMLGKTPDGSDGNLTTYKELSSLASEMGKPELMYKFLNLSSHNQIWSSKKGAAFATKSIISSQLAKQQLEPYLNDLVPKLYRYSYDPNPRLAQSMSSVLNTIVDTSKLIDLYWSPIIKELMEGIGSRVWRVRESSLNAIPDAIRSRNFHDLAPYFEQLYTMVFRGMDDIKESVAKAGIAAAKSLALLTSRICDPVYTSHENVNLCLKISVPFLLDKGLHNLADEVKVFSIETLHSITKSSGDLITPFVPRLASVLLENLSLYEPAVFNYIDQKAEEYGTTKDELEDIRVRISSSAPLSKTIDLCSHHLDESTVKEMVEKINHLISHGVGMPTKVGVCKFIQSLVRLYPDLIKPFSPRLIRRLTTQLVNRSLAIRKSIATAISHLSKLSSFKSLAILLQYLSTLYIDKAGPLSAADQSLHGSVVSLTLNELSKNASSLMMGGGKEGGCGVDCIPLCFIGTCDLSDATNRDLFISTWNEIGVGGSERIYSDEIIQLIIKCLGSSSWTMRAQGAVALSKLCDKISHHILPHSPSLFPLLLSHFKEKRIWTGKEKLFLSLSSLVKASLPLFLSSSPSSSSSSSSSSMNIVVENSPDKSEHKKDGNNKAEENKVEGKEITAMGVEIVTLMLEESGRGESEYKRQALTNLNVILSLFCPHLDCFDTVLTKITPLIKSTSSQIEISAKEQVKDQEMHFKSSSSSSSSSSDIAENGKEKARKTMILAECFDILGNAFPSSLPSQLRHSSSTTLLLTSQLNENTWNIKIKILAAITKMIKRLDKSVLLLHSSSSHDNIIIDVDDDDAKKDKEGEMNIEEINIVERILDSLKDQIIDAKYSNVREAALLALKSLSLSLSQNNALADYKEKIRAMLQHREREPPLQILIKEILHYLLP